MQEGTLVDLDAPEAEEREVAAACAAPSAAPGPENGNGVVPDIDMENGIGAVTDVGREMALAARAASRKLQAAPTEVTVRGLSRHLSCCHPLKAVVAGTLHRYIKGILSRLNVGS